MSEFKAFLETFKGVACVLSVDLKVEHGAERYHVVDGNDAYRMTVVKSLDEFVEDVPYTRYIQQAATSNHLWNRVRPVENLSTHILILSYTMPGWRYSTCLLIPLILIRN